MELAVDPLEVTRRTSPGDEEDLLPSLLGGDGGWQVEELLECCLVSTVS